MKHGTGSRLESRWNRQLTKMVLFPSKYALLLLLSWNALYLVSCSHGETSLPADRNRRQSSRSKYDIRDCESDDPYLPETVVPTDHVLRELREEMRLQDLDAYIIPYTDAHQSDYVADRDKRLQFISGFSGTSALGIVTRNRDFVSRNKAAVWVDARYFIQAKQEMDCNWLSMEIGEENVLEPQDWLTGDTFEYSDEEHAQLPDSARVGFDARLFDIITYEIWNETFYESPRNIKMIPIERNLIDEVWEESVNGEENLPEYPGEELIPLEKTYTGRTWQSKIFYDDPEEDFDYTIRQIMNEKKAEALVIHKLDEVAWLFNLRGEDIPYNPVFISFSIILRNEIRLYMWEGTKRTDSVRYKEVYDHLGLGCTSGQSCISLRDYEDFYMDLEQLGGTSRTIWHSNEAPFAIYQRVRDINRIEEPSPILLMKAQKNEQEIIGMKSANIKDSVALCNLFGWLQEKMDGMDDREMARGSLQYLSEQKVMEESIFIRQSLFQEVYHGESFATISAFAEHGGLLFYNVTEETNLPIHFNEIFLFESGAQYLEGTTKISRTFYFGKPTEKMINAYTLALKGHMQLLLAHFRSGVYGRELEGIARSPLWSNGLDYRYPTGHGIGHFLNVEEGPARIGLGYKEYEYEYEQPIYEGMFFTNEPGYFEEEEFGIKIGNAMYAKRVETDYQYGTHTYLQFEVVSLVPFEPNLIDYQMFTREEVRFYNQYMQRIQDEVGRNSKLTSRGREWVEGKTHKIEIERECRWKYSAAEARSAPHKTVVAVTLVMSLVFLKVW